LGHFRLIFGQNSLPIYPYYFEVIAILSEVKHILSEVIAISYPNFGIKGHFFRNLSFDKKEIYLYRFVDTRVRTHAREKFFEA
jgi:hypothetical protein